jgi:hypothetical protein
LVDKRRTVEVSWHEYAGCWDTTPINDLSNGKFMSLRNATIHIRAEIIGNIYENPELIYEHKLQ